jgi:hypothetical protein
MCCLVLLVGFLGPRLGIFLLWIFDNARMSAAFNHFWEAFIGFLVLPWTTFAWAICYQPIVGVKGFGWIIVGFGLFLDILTYTGGARRQQQQSMPPPAPSY